MTLSQAIRTLIRLGLERDKDVTFVVRNAAIHEGMSEGLSHIKRHIDAAFTSAFGPESKDGFFRDYKVGKK